jgi:hypothetical protein
MKEIRLFMRSRHIYLLFSLLSFEKRRKQVQISWMDANLIGVSPERCDTGGLAYPYRGTLN